VKLVSDMSDLEFMYLIGHLGGWCVLGGSRKSWEQYWGFTADEIDALNARARQVKADLQGKEIAKS